jgi:type IV fimbrial biogenesis protein FimT
VTDVAPRRSRHSRGLTLIELMIAIAVVAVLMSLAVPSFGSALQRQRLKGAAQVLATDLAEARFESARRGQPLHVVFKTGADWCYTMAADASCDCRVAQACRLRTARAEDARGVHLVEAPTASFDPAGGASAASAAVLQTANGERLRVELSPLGRARICAPEGAMGAIPVC